MKVKVGDVCKSVYSGQIMSRVSAKDEIGEEVIEERQVLIPKAIANGRVVHSDLGEAKLKKVVDPERITQRGDIVVKLSTPYDAAYVGEEDEGLIVPSFCAIIRGINGQRADARFLTAYINTDYVKELLKSKVAGTTMPMIKINDIRGLEIPQVSLPGQKSLGEAYMISCEKQDVLREMLENEKRLINNIILRAMREVE